MSIASSTVMSTRAMWHLITFFPHRAYTALCNGRSPVRLMFNFAKNFSIVFIWLMIFKQAGLIPTDIRPAINVTILRDADAFIFEDFSGFVCGIFLTAIVWAFAYLVTNDTNELYEEYQRNAKSANLFVEKRKASSESDYVSTPTSLSSLSSAEDEDNYSVGSDSTTIASGEKQGTSWISANTICISLVSLIWLYLNLETMGIDYLCKTKDIVAWFSYVILHLAAPIITACYLWLFNPPGLCGTFGLALGTQNIMGVCTHLLFPTAPPWYNHKFGETPGTYDMEGYAAGLTRVDTALGTHIHSKGFHKSPIVFGAFPSLHSAFVCLIFLFISRYARWGVRGLPVGTVVTAGYALWQWWATMYLDHHWRLDLVGGALYACISFAIFLPRMRRFEREFVTSPATTGGMRLFANCFLENWFNPVLHTDLFSKHKRHGYYPAGSSQATLALDDLEV